MSAIAETGKMLKEMKESLKEVILKNMDKADVEIVYDTKDGFAVQHKQKKGELSYFIDFYNKDGEFKSRMIHHKI